MSDEIQIEGKSYISSKRASQESGYAQDYIGQLARKNLIDARRIGGLWYVSIDSLLSYQKKAEEFKPEPPSRPDAAAEPGTLVFFDGKEYVSAGRAAELTGYAQDYVGQLARSGTILSRQVGNRWYVEKQSVLTHKKEKDALLAAVQSDSVGLRKAPDPQAKALENPVKAGRYEAGPYLNYFKENGDLMPQTGREPMPENAEIKAQNEDIQGIETAQEDSAQTIAIRRVRQLSSRPVRGRSERTLQAQPAFSEANKSSFPLLLGAAATIIIVLSVGYASVLRQNSVYALNIKQIGGSSLPAAVDTAFSKIGDLLEPFLTRELVYQRSTTGD